MARRKKYSVSKAEKEILVLLKESGYDVIPQYRVVGIPYLYDFYFPKLNLLLEYNGDFFHANPQKYAPGDLIRMPGLKEKVLANHLWDKDLLKKTSAEKQGYIVKYLWETDYKRDGVLALKRCLLG